MKLKVVIEPGEDSGFVARVPALRGCWSQGRTRDEALANVREAIEAWLEVEQDKADRSSRPADVELVTV
jgi:predicted RNase H-like HicB family nuclease